MQKQSGGLWARPRDAGVGDDPRSAILRYGRLGEGCIFIPSSLAIKWREPLSLSQRARSAARTARASVKAPGGKAKTPSLLIGRRGRAVEATEERANLV
jgi:hypothetical protein